jgi:hypothetical protein
MASVPRRVYKTVEWAFYNVDVLRAAVKAHDDEVLDDLQKPRIPKATGGGIGYHSDSTALSAIKLIEGGSRDIRRYRKWVKVVDAITDYYAGTVYGQLIEMYYQQGCKEVEICRKLHVDRRTFYRMKEEIIASSWRVGVENGVLKAIV